MKVCKPIWEKKITLVLLFSTLFGCKEKNENFRVNMSEIFC